MSITRHSKATWEGNLKDGAGKMRIGNGPEQAFSFKSRFENGDGTNPEELIGAAHAGCFSMAFSNLLAENGHNPKAIETTADVHLENKNGAFKITEINLKTKVDAPGIPGDDFDKLATMAKENCPVSQALSAIKITLDARLIS